MPNRLFTNDNKQTNRALYNFNIEPFVVVVGLVYIYRISTENKKKTSSWTNNDTLAFSCFSQFGPCLFLNIYYCKVDAFSLVCSPYYVPSWLSPFIFLFFWILLVVVLVVVAGCVTRVLLLIFVSVFLIFFIYTCRIMLFSV